MRKLILLLALVMALSVVGVVMADTQNTDVTVSGTTTVVITPPTLSFGTVSTGDINVPATNGPIKFDPAGSNTDVTVTGTSTTGDSLFSTKLEVETSPGVWVLISTNPSAPMTCTGSPCTYTPATWNARLSSIPSGYPAGLKNGAIIYTVSGTPPA